MKFYAINSSPRKNFNTAKILDSFLEGIKAIFVVQGNKKCIILVQELTKKWGHFDKILNTTLPLWLTLSVQENHSMCYFTLEFIENGKNKKISKENLKKLSGTNT